MKITDVRIRACSVSELTPSERGRLRGEAAPDVVVISLDTDEGITGTAFGFGGLDAKLCAPSFAAVKPFILGRDPLDRERNFQDYRFFDRRWNNLPIADGYASAPIGPGLGVDYDWDQIDGATVATF